MFWHCCEKILENLGKVKFIPDELQDLEKVLASIYYCNFSIFQSAPDTWAIDQLFPILPIHKLDEQPTNRATLADLTCDSDGMIDHFIDVEDVKHTLPVHAYDPEKPYYLGMFLIGAYQEILGDLHNLFGDTNAVHVRLAEEGYYIAHVIKGDSVKEVLRYVEYDTEDMVERVRQQAERALASGKMTLPQMRLLMRHYDESLDSYTYLTDDDG
jgi:arginine decarboxylase